jgi:heme A synthase
MTHLLLGAILAVLVYALMWRPWRERREEARLHRAPEPRWHPVTVRCVVCCVVALPALVILVRAIYG